MTPDRFHECLAALRWSQRGLADALTMDERQVRRWAAGARIPDGIAAWLELAAQKVGPLLDARDAWLKENPPPAKNSG